MKMAGPQEYVLKSGTFYLCNDIVSEFKLEKWYPLIGKYNVNSTMVLPIRKYGTIIGTLNLYSTVLNLFDEQEIILLNEVANDISFTLDVFENDKHRKLMEKRVAHSELHLKQAQAIAHFGSWERNFITDEVVWSEEACKIYGVDVNNNILSFDNWLSFIHPDDIDYVLKFIKESDAILKSGTFQHRIVRPDGSMRHLQSHFHFELGPDGTPMSVYGVARDITETRIAELALAQSEANLRQIMDLLPQSVFVKNHEGRYVFINKSFAGLFGVTAHKLIGKRTADVNPMDSQVSSLIAEDWEVIDSGKSKVNKEHLFTFMDGTSRIFHTIKVPFTVPVINEKAVLCITDDITEQKQAEEEKAKMTADIIQRNKDLEQFSYIVSHNMRAPLANILGLAEVMEISGFETAR
jgi:PAS domain S-box-containing protein